VVGEGQLTVKEGYFGLVVEHADRRESIPFVRRTDDLEYRLASIIRSLSRTEKPRVGLALDPQAGNHAALREELGRSYTVESVFLDDPATSLDGLAALVIASARDSVAADAVEKVGAWLERGGKALILEGGMAVSQQMPFAFARPVAWNAVLSRYGVQVRQDMVYDLRANQVVGVPTNFGQLLRSYPYFVRGQSTRGSIVNAEVNEVALPWTSSIDTVAVEGREVTPLVVTSEAAGLSMGQVMIDPGQTFPATDLGQRLLGVQVAPSGEAGTGPRLIVVGSAMVASDDLARRSPENLLFALNAVDWLAQDEALISIRAKDRRPPALVFESTAVKEGVKYLNVVGLPALFALYGFVRLLRRRRLAAMPYRRLAEAA
jgi:ABC-type uncharacterized transport system involved in gliding motility auxiliary subunit